MYVAGTVIAKVDEFLVFATSVIGVARNKLRICNSMTAGMSTSFVSDQ